MDSSAEYKILTSQYSLAYNGQEEKVLMAVEGSSKPTVDKMDCGEYVPMEAIDRICSCAHRNIYAAVIFAEDQYVL